jgi:hypothetical protein
VGDDVDGDPKAQADPDNNVEKHRTFQWEHLQVNMEASMRCEVTSGNNLRTENFGAISIFLISMQQSRPQIVYRGVRVKPWTTPHPPQRKALGS